MRLVTFIILGFITATLVTSIIIALIPSVDDFNPDNPLWNGLSEFRRLYNVSLISATGLAGLKPGVAIVMGVDRGFSSVEVEHVKSFIERGGVLIVLEDYGNVGYELLRSLGLNVEPYEGVLVDPIYYHKDYILPRVTLMGDVGGYFNKGTSIKSHDGTCIGWSSRFSFQDLNVNNVYDVGEPTGPLCVAVEWSLGRGRIILVSDSSIALNSMINLNKELLDSIIGGNEVYVISDKWSKSLYSVLRSNAVNLYDVLTGTQARYILAVILVALYPLVYKLISSLRGGEVEDVEKHIREVVEVHPSWSFEELRVVARDWYERRGSKS